MKQNRYPAHLTRHPSRAKPMQMSVTQTLKDTGTTAGLKFEEVQLKQDPEPACSPMSAQRDNGRESHVLEHGQAALR